MRQKLNQERFWFDRRIFFSLEGQSSIGTNCPGSPCSLHLQVFSSHVKGWLDKVLNNLIWSHSRPCLDQIGLGTSHGLLPPEWFCDFAILCAIILLHLQEWGVASLHSYIGQLFCKQSLLWQYPSWVLLTWSPNRQAHVGGRNMFLF